MGRFTNKTDAVYTALYIILAVATITFAGAMLLPQAGAQTPPGSSGSTTSSTGGSFPFGSYGGGITPSYGTASGVTIGASNGITASGITFSSNGIGASGFTIGSSFGGMASGIGITPSFGISTPFGGGATGGASGVGASSGGVQSAAGGYGCPYPYPIEAELQIAKVLESVYDNKYRNTCKKGKNFHGIQGPGCEGWKATQNFSTLKRIPFVWQEAGEGVGIYRSKDESGNSLPEVSQMFGEGGCTENPLFAGKDPVTMRLKYIDCANQYILALRHFPYFIMDRNKTDVPDLNEEYCQPLRQIPDLEREYKPSDYLKKALEGLKVESTWPLFPWTTTELSIPHVMNGCVPNGSTTCQFERIFDPSHPFSPRQDYDGNERDTYSIFTQIYEYARQPLPSPPKCAVACASVPVDIMSFRKSKFQTCIGCRIAINIACWATQFVPLYDYCYTPLRTARKFPPCSTRFDVDDNVPEMCDIPCGKIKDCCEDLAKPVVPINALKIRTNDPDHKNFPHDPPEGYTFKEYFGNHRPFMRWWDTGAEAGSVLNGTVTKPQLRSTLGALDSIVGVGREDGGQCRFGGDGVPRKDRAQGPYKSQTVADVLIGNQEDSDAKPTNPNTGWGELKLYQARTTRYYGLSCIGQYEKLFKQFGSEEKALTIAGGAIALKNPDYIEEVGLPLSWRGYVSYPADPKSPNKTFPRVYGSPSAPASTNSAGIVLNDKGIVKGGLDNAQVNDILIYNYDVFAKASGAAGSSSSSSGGASSSSGEAEDDGGPPQVKHRMPVLAVVVTADNKASNGGTEPENARIDVVDADNGKFPDACGNTNALGFGSTRTLYKRRLPEDFKQKLLAAGHSDVSCKNGDIKMCVEDLWDHVLIYRPVLDVRILNSSSSSGGH